MASSTVRSCIIIGGGAAGMTAGVTLVRTRRLVTIIDAGTQSNRAAHAAQNFFTRDGQAPSDLYSISHEQFKKYPSGQILNTQVSGVTKNEKGNFLVSTASGETLETKTILLAQGMNYKLPAIPGLKEIWGSKAFHCPFCHGYEVSDKRILVMIKSFERLHHMVAILRTWTSNVVYAIPADAVVEEDVKKNIAKTKGEIVGRVKKIVDVGESLKVETESGEVSCDAVLVECDIDQRDDLVEKLGVEKQAAGPFANFVKVDDYGRTNVKGVYCAGDQHNPRAQIAVAAGSGSMAATTIHMELSMEELAELH